MTKVIVVGAGSAGCVIASELSDQPALEVLLLEAGADRSPGHRPDRLRSISFMEAIDEADAFWSDVMASFRNGEEARAYLRGKGVGGSGSINAMIALPGLASDYDRWRDQFGCAGWGWQDVEPVFRSLAPGLRQVSPTELTPVDTALLGAASDLGYESDIDLLTDETDGAGRLWLTADEAGRRSSAEAFLDPARSRRSLEVRSGAQVVALVQEGRRVTGVRLADGSVLDADHVVLCAGTFGSAEILLRSGVDRRGLGANLRDHAAVKVDMVLGAGAAPEDRTKPTIGTVLRASSGRSPSDVHFLPMHGDLAYAPAGAGGLLVMSLMTVTSSGSVRLEGGGPDGRRVIDCNQISSSDDKQAFASGLKMLTDVLRTPTFRAATDQMVVGDEGTLDSLLDDEFVDTWLPGRLGQYLHPVGTCRMGDPSDDEAVVDLDGSVIGHQGVSVVDASVMPDIPAANTHLPTVMIATRLAGRIADHLS